MDEHEALVKKAVAEHSVVALVGGLDSGKTTLSRQMMREALGAGRIPAYLDADLGQKSVGPPTTVGLKLIRSEEDLDPARMVLADACYFVGAISPQGNLLPVVTGVARLLQRARADGTTSSSWPAPISWWGSSGARSSSRCSGSCNGSCPARW